MFESGEVERLRSRAERLRNFEERPRNSQERRLRGPRTVLPSSIRQEYLYLYLHLFLYLYLHLFLYLYLHLFLYLYSVFPLVSVLYSNLYFSSKEEEDGGADYLGGGGEEAASLVRGLRLQDPQRGHGTFLHFRLFVNPLFCILEDHYQSHVKGDVLPGCNCEASGRRQCLSLDPNFPRPCFSFHHRCGILSLYLC